MTTGISPPVIRASSGSAIRVAVMMRPSRKPEVTTLGYSALSSSSFWNRNRLRVVPDWLLAVLIPWIRREK